MYTEKDLVRIAKRDNNKKRNYLVVNPLQGKHVPVKPGAALDLFCQFTDSWLGEYENERLLFIGFAETATAIGAAAALRAGVPYIQTTREMVPGAEYLYFSEEHSHAAEQKLVRNDIDRILGKIDRIIFIEDEVTTGKTILNMIRVWKGVYPGGIRFSAASLLNGMDETAENIYKEQGIKLHYLVKTEHSGYARAADRCVPDGTYHSCAMQCAVPKAAETVSGGAHFLDSARCNRVHITEIEVKGRMDTRRLVQAEQYRRACASLWEQVDKRLHGEISGKVLVLGTEEFMYPPLYAAYKIQQTGGDAVFHATTRSPVLVGRAPDYPLHERYELRSMYDPERITYVYDLAAYDTVLVITDASNAQTQGTYSLVHALMEKNEKNQNIYIIRWVET